jgi:hypothetical protein
MKKAKTFCRSKTYDNLLSTEIWLNIRNDGYKLVETSYLGMDIKVL